MTSGREFNRIELRGLAIVAKGGMIKRRVCDDIDQDVDALDKHLRRVLNDLQTRIKNVVTQIAPTEHNPLLSTCGKAIEVSSSGK